MTNNVLCDEFTERLADLLERDVDEAARAALEAHALACPDCGALLADLRNLRIDAANLPSLAPSRDLWQGISDRIDAPVIPLRVAAGDRASVGRPWARWASLAAAAAVLVTITSITTHYVTLQTSAQGTSRVAANNADAFRDTANAAPRPTVAPQKDSATPSVVAQRRAPVRQEPAATSSAQFASNARKPSAEQVYATEIARLHDVVEKRRAQLDPVTVSVIERNLKVIDDAIAQCKLALEKDPASRFLMESLNSALETKVELLRTAAMLPSRS
jgi:hypothetical protein